MKKHGENSVEDVERFRKCSPEFLWVIRDRTLKITDMNDEPCDINTYLGQKVLTIEYKFYHKSGVEAVFIWHFFQYY